MQLATRCLLIMLAATLMAACGDEGTSTVPPIGGSTPTFPSTEGLIAELNESDVACPSERPFDPAQNVASDAIDYATPEGTVCSGERQLHVIVYESIADRVRAAETWQVNTTLCSFTQDDEPDPEGWSSVVAGNWRVAAPGEDVSLDDVRKALGPTAEAEPLSCEFRA